MNACAWRYLAEKWLVFCLSLTPFRTSCRAWPRLRDLSPSLSPPPPSRPSPCLGAIKSTRQELEESWLLTATSDATARREPGRTLPARSFLSVYRVFACFIAVANYASNIPARRIAMKHLRLLETNNFFFFIYAETLFGRYKVFWKARRYFWKVGGFAFVRWEPDGIFPLINGESNVCIQILTWYNINIYVIYILWSMVKYGKTSLDVNEIGDVKMSVDGLNLFETLQDLLAMLWGLFRKQYFRIKKL